ncbi:MAG: glycosyltransferase [Gemmatimonadota bacterium]|nr:glycosyltransferase [Gemmatimonadota bacterium]
MVADVLLVAQTIALAVLGVRLWPGRTRRPPVAPCHGEIVDTTVSVIVASLNEAARIGPCLAGLRTQGRPLLEVLVVDSRSTDGTRELVESAARLDPRVRLLTDDPLPAGWVGKVWALEHGLHAARGEWVLGIDADTEPMPGLVAGVIAAARNARYSVVSFSPKFAAQSRREQFIQPALLLTLIYRSGAVGSDCDPERVLANGQCFLARRDVLLRHGGYRSARASFADDVTLARHLAREGERVGFLDGSRLYLVRSYRTAGEMWREWGRSLDLRQATSATRQWVDLGFLIVVQGLPLLLLTALGTASLTSTLSATGRGLVLVNAVLLVIHLLLLRPLSRSYEHPGLPFWLSGLADPLAVARIVMSTVARRRTWRGRQY